MQRIAISVLVLSACGGNGVIHDGFDAQDNNDAFHQGDGGGNGVSPEIAGCAVLPPDHIFNTPIASLPALHGDSDAWVGLIGNTTRLHLDLGTETDQTATDYYGIPYNFVHGDTMTWAQVAFTTPDTDFDWDPTDEADCANAQKGIVSPCNSGTAYLPFPANALVEGGLSTSASHMPAEDHHLIALDVDNCRLWEGYHVYRPGGQWQIFGAATFDLGSNDLRTAGWTSADAAGFPILPLLLRADEASTGEIKHALRFTMTSGNIRGEYTWPARHEASMNTSTGSPPMGQLFRLKDSFDIPANWSTQSKAIAQAMKTYGMYIADGGSNWYVTGAPGAWDDSVFDEIQSIQGMNFEAVDLRPIIARPGFDGNSGRVPPM